MLEIKEPKTYHSDFDLHKNAEKNLKHETEFHIKYNKSLAEYKINNKIDQLLYEYKHENDIHEPRKQ